MGSRLHAHAVQGGFVICLPRPQFDAGETGVVGAVGIMLCFQRHGIRLAIGMARRPDVAAVKRVGCIDLQPPGCVVSTFSTRPDAGSHRRAAGTGARDSWPLTTQFWS